MRPRSSFRGRLLLAMMLVVAAATGATLVVLQRGVEATYRRIAEERFASDVRAFAALDAARLGAVRSRCLELARSVRLIAAVGERDAALLYRIAVDELRDVLRPAADGPGERPARFFRFVGADGVVVAPPDDRIAAGERPEDAGWEGYVAAVTRGLTAAEPQRTGYLAPVIGGRPVLREAVVTRIVDPVGERPLGALVLLFPVEDDPEPIPSGILLGDRLYSRSIPEALRPALARTVGHEGAVLDVDGVPHRLFERVLHPGSGFPPAYRVGLYSMADALARQRELRGKVLVAGALALVLGVGLSVVLARGLAVPIRELAAAAGAIGGGSLAVTVPVRSDDEIGRLAAAFNDMVAGLVLKEKYRSVLDLVADRDVAEHLLAGRLTLGGELRDASVLFCDIRGFTALTETMPPPQVIELLNEHMSALTRVVHANGGAVDKFVGDSLIALFGAPRTTGRDAHNAVRTAWEMVAARTALNRTGRQPLAVGVGIASGTVVAGCMGSSERLEYTVLGARVNLAARLCAQAGPMEVLVDDATRAQLGDALGADPLPPLQLKGFSAPVAAWRVTDVRAVPGAS